MNVELLLTPLDGARGRVLGVLGPLAPRLLADRQARVGVYGLFGVSVALALSAVSPLWLLALGPIFLGIPHLVADVRYLLVRPGVTKRRALFLVLAATLVASIIWPSMAVGATSIMAVALMANGSWSRRAAVLALGVALALASKLAPVHAPIYLAHAHNAIAIVFFLLWRVRDSRWHLPMSALFVFAAYVILSGGLDRFVLESGGFIAPATGLSIAELANQLAPPEWSARFALRAVLFFAFAQSVHYVVWLRLLPELDRDRPGLRSFRSSFRALSNELGRGMVLVCLAASVALIAFAVVNLPAARDVYFRGAVFHAYLEIAALGLFFIEGLPKRAG